jgi:hypothetical protein
VKLAFDPHENSCPSNDTSTSTLPLPAGDTAEDRDERKKKGTCNCFDNRAAESHVHCSVCKIETFARNYDCCSSALRSMIWFYGDNAHTRLKRQLLQNVRQGYTRHKKIRNTLCLYMFEFSPEKFPTVNKCALVGSEAIAARAFLSMPLPTPTQ